MQMVSMWVIVDTIYLTVGTVMETFETGDMAAFPWQTNNNPWFVTNEQHSSVSKFIKQ